MLAIPTPASAVARTTNDPSDAPAGPQGKTDLRSITWDLGSSTTTLTVAVDESTYGGDERAQLGVHVLLDTDVDGIADVEVAATRNANGVAMDLVLRTLDGTLSTDDCQDLSGKSTGQAATVSSTIAGGLESFAFTFDDDSVPGGLAEVRWAAFGQSPGDTTSNGPWDYVPDAANPDPDTANPGDRRCDASKSGLLVDLSAGVDLNPATCPGHGSDDRNQVVGTAGKDILSGTPAADVVCGLGGADAISGLGGGDVLLGGTGRDTLDGGRGRDVADGGAGNDLVRGGPGPDTLRGGTGDDDLRGQGGVDSFAGGPGTDSCDAVAGESRTGCESLTA
jgi:hypothetical protein